MATTARCGRSSRSLESLGIWRRSYRCRGEWWAPAWCRILMDPQSSSILRELGVNSEVTRLPHRVLWTEAFFGVKKIAMHHASRSAKPPFAFVQHFSTCCNSFPHQSSPHPVQQLSAWPQLSGVIKPLTIPVYSHRFRKRFRTSSAVWVLAKGASVLTCICANLAFAKSLI